MRITSITAAKRTLSAENLRQLPHWPGEICTFGAAEWLVTHVLCKVENRNTLFKLPSSSRAYICLEVPFHE